MAVTKDEKLLLQGTRDLMTGLWRVPLQSLERPTNQSNKTNQVNGKENAITYLNTTALSSVQDTWETSVNQGYFNTWPVIKAEGINKMPKAETKIKSHLTHIRKNTQSTTTNNKIGDQHTNADPSKGKKGKKYILMTTVDKSHKIYICHMKNYRCHLVEATSM